MTTCYIYRCSAKQDMYLYLAEKDDFECLPDELRNKLGTLDFALELELDADKKLAKENPETVIENLKNQKFHLQMPSETSVEQLMEKIASQSRED